MELGLASTDEERTLPESKRRVERGKGRDREREREREMGWVRGIE